MAVGKETPPPRRWQKAAGVPPSPGRRGAPIDRLSVRRRPGGWPVMHQVWERLLFIHWPVAEELLRPLVPPPLAIDTYAGQAWVGVTPFHLSGLRPPLLPPLPWLSQFEELNVRTYVHLGGVPGVWFLSLDASSRLSVWGARLTYGLPYYRADMSLRESGRALHFTSRRTHHGAPPATFEGTWERGERLPLAAPDSLEFFLIERYCLYTVRNGRPRRARIFHRPWSLCRVERPTLSSTMLESHGLPTPATAPLLHAQADPLHVEVWPLEIL